MISDYEIDLTMNFKTLITAYLPEMRQFLFGSKGRKYSHKFKPKRNIAARILLHVRQILPKVMYFGWQCILFN